MGQSLAQALAGLDPEDRDAYLDALDEREAAALLADWRFWARPEQRAPDWAWRWWLLITGRGFGKNRTASEWVADRCEAFAGTGSPHLVGLIGQNNDDVKDLQLGGVSGLREVIARRGHRWAGADTSLKPRIGVRSGRGWHWSKVEVHTAVEPEGPRGRNFHTLWVDELAAFKHKTDAVGNTVFTNAELALRGRCPDGLLPQGCVTTTPKPIPIIRDLLAGKHGPTEVTRGSMFDNAANLTPHFVEAILNAYAGTRLAEQEIYGKVVDSIEGALWNADLIARWRVNADQVPALSSTVVAVDPSGSEGGDECGIVVVGVAANPDHRGLRHVYVLDDCSVRNRPETWAKAAVNAYWAHGAHEIVAEVNFGAKLVADVVKLTDRAVKFREVRASAGKRVRAEPVALMYEAGQGRVHHVGVFPQMEEQMCFWTPLDPTSPDRMDALVWGCTALLPELTVGRAAFRGWV